MSSSPRGRREPILPLCSLHIFCSCSPWVKSVEETGKLHGRRRGRGPSYRSGCGSIAFWARISHELNNKSTELDVDSPKLHALTRRLIRDMTIPSAVPASLCIHGQWLASKVGCFPSGPSIPALHSGGNTVWLSAPWLADGELNAVCLSD